MIKKKSPETWKCLKFCFICGLRIHYNEKSIS